MLDENLPTFYSKPSTDNPHESTLFLSSNGSELKPEYVLRHPDPQLPESKNCYAIGLYDSYNPEILYAEVLIRPEWTQPSLSTAEIRAMGGGSHAPSLPIIPNNFVINLYNPDQQVTIRQISGTWNTSTHWEFEMPEHSFRVPSASALDQSQGDPPSSAATTKIRFKWKRDGKLTKDMTCYLMGKPAVDKRNREPDIPVAMYKNSKNLTLYEPNMNRVDVEDIKGMEVVLILGSVVIKDIYFNGDREMFNIFQPAATSVRIRRRSSGPGVTTAQRYPLANTVHGPGGGPPGPVMSGAVLTSPISPTQPQSQQFPGRPAVSQPIAQPTPQYSWEIDAETARLKALVLAEENERARAEQEEEARLKKMLEEEEKERQRREAQIARETERLRNLYGVASPPVGPPPGRPFLQLSPPSLPPRPMPQYQSAPHSMPSPVQRPLSTPGYNYSYTGVQAATNWGQLPPQNGRPHGQTIGNAGPSSGGFFGLGGKNKVQKKKSGFF